jgi:hypothetical protein
MRRAVPGIALAVGLLTACGPSRTAPGTAEQTLSAAAASDTAEVTVPPPSTTTVPPLATTTTLSAAVAPPTTRPARAPSRAYSPPPPAGVHPDGYGGYGGAATATADGTAVTLQVYPREQYLGERVQVSVRVAGTTAVRSIVIDLGDGTVVHPPQLQSWGCPSAPRETGGGAPAHVYAAPGAYRVTAVVTAVPCTILPGPPGGWTGPDGQPAVGMPLPWVPSGPDQTVPAAIDVNQRPQRPPSPVGPPPGA